MSEPIIVGGVLLLIGIVVMIGSMRDRHPSAALMMATGAILTIGATETLAKALLSGPYATTVLVVRPILIVGCVVLGVRALRRAYRQPEKPNQSSS